MTRTQALRHARRHKEVTPACRRFIYRALRHDLTVTSTTGGKHAPGSWHYARWRGMGRAVDVAGPYSNMRRFYTQEVRREIRTPGVVGYHELFGPGRTYVKNGRRHPGQFPHHEDHIHGAPRGVV